MHQILTSVTAQVMRYTCHHINLCCLAQIRVYQLVRKQNRIFTSWQLTTYTYLTQNRLSHFNSFEVWVSISFLFSLDAHDKWACLVCFLCWIRFLKHGRPSLATTNHRVFTQRVSLCMRLTTPHHITQVIRRHMSIELFVWHQTTH